MSTAFLGKRHALEDVPWLVGFPLIAGLLLAVTFHAASQQARYIAPLEAGACSKHSPAAAVHLMLALH